MGYVEETGVAQHVRDARIAPIYEGTNGIQAIDLVLRKLPVDDGAMVLGFLDGLDGELAAASADLDEVAEAVSRAHGKTVSPTRIERIVNGIQVVSGDAVVGEDGEELWAVTSGGPELATIGTGDVLTGMVAALIASGLDAETAAICDEMQEAARKAFGLRSADGENASA
jgi:hypothetical protein